MFVNSLALALTVDELWKTCEIPRVVPLEYFFSTSFSVRFLLHGRFPSHPRSLSCSLSREPFCFFQFRSIFLFFFFPTKSVFLLLFCMGAFTPSSPLCEVSHSLETSLFIFLPRLRLEVMGIFVSHHLPLWQYRFFSIGIQRVDNPFCFSYGNDPM